MNIGTIANGSGASCQRKSAEGEGGKKGAFHSVPFFGVRSLYIYHITDFPVHLLRVNDRFFTNR